MIYSAKMTRYRIDMSSFSFATKKKFPAMSYTYEVFIF